jgi:hypothetical protein
VLSRIQSLLACVQHGAPGAEQQAQELFYRLARLISPDVLGHPPSRAVYERGVGLLGARVIASCPTEMRPLLQLCAEVPERTLFVQGFFNPNLCTEDFADLYTLVGRVGGLNDVRCVGALVEHFHVKAWAADPSVTAELRKQAVQSIAAQIEASVTNTTQCNANAPPETSTAEARLLGVHCCNLDIISTHNFAEAYDHVLEVLVDGSSL